MDSGHRPSNRVPRRRQADAHVLSHAVRRELEGAVWRRWALGDGRERNRDSSTARSIAGKVIISCVNPLGFDKPGPYGLSLGSTSAAESAQRLVPTASVVGAFHHLSAASLNGDAAVLDHEDVLVCGDDDSAKASVIDLACTVTGKPGSDAGALRMARQLEPLTAVLISINKRYKVRSGIAVSGLS